MKFYTFLLIAVSLSLAACGGGSAPAPNPIPTFTIGGTVTNLAGMGGGLQLQDDGTDALLVNANGSFTFATALPSRSVYNVTVFRQPSSPAQTCAVTQADGVATANVTSVAVDCGHNEWTWIGGSNVGDQKGTYGTQGMAAAANIPGARAHFASWTDASGNFWLFGGFGWDSTGTLAAMNDLWKYSGGQWTWMGGSNVGNQLGTYGTQGMAAATNIPGARQGAVAWTDAAGNVWLFGGFAGTSNYFNDLWKYSAGQWTWMGGSNLVNQPGIYGTQGIAAMTNIPGARENAVTWTDAAGNFWFFGGDGYDSAGTTLGELNDLWKYSGGQWTWIGGSNMVNKPGTYGTQGTPASGNVPGARTVPTTWTDASGNFWLFGGLGYDSAGTTLGYLNDLWKYSGGQWTWMGGSNVVNQPGIYGTLSMPAPGNVPGARGRGAAVTRTDAAGNFWLFGGAGYDSAGTNGFLNDLWKHSGGQWTWMGGSNVVNQKGTYGIQGTPAPGNVPGARRFSVFWIDASGNFWLFGGRGYDSTGTTLGQLNDLWKYEP